MTLNLPDELSSLAESRARQTGQSVEQYLASLIHADAERPISPELEAELLAALRTPSRELSAADWDRKRQALIERHRQTRAG